MGLARLRLGYDLQIFFLCLSVFTKIRKHAILAKKKSVYKLLSATQINGYDYRGLQIKYKNSFMLGVSVIKYF
jgi:hypothetical protein